MSSHYHFDRDFNQIHGRHVMKPEDIAPVAGEYQRYKVLMPCLYAEKVYWAEGYICRSSKKD